MKAPRPILTGILSIGFLGGTFGRDPAAYRAALQAVKALVGTDARPSP